MLRPFSPARMQCLTLARGRRGVGARRPFSTRVQSLISACISAYLSHLGLAPRLASRLSSLGLHLGFPGAAQALGSSLMFCRTSSMAASTVPDFAVRNSHHRSLYGGTTCGVFSSPVTHCNRIVPNVRGIHSLPSSGAPDQTLPWHRPSLGGVSRAASFCSPRGHGVDH